MDQEELRRIVSASQLHGRRTYSRWDADAFICLTESAATKLCMRLPPDLSSRRLLTAYIKLIEEGIGLGLLVPASETLLGHCLIGLAPTNLPDLPEPARIQTLAEIWNLCESVTKLPIWAYKYISVQARECLTDVQKLREFLERESSILFSKRAAPCWKGELSGTVLNTKSLAPLFLPGEVSLLTPNVAAVKDRRAAMAIALIFREQTDPYLVGPLSSEVLISYTDPAPPQVFFTKKGIQVEEAKVSLPFMTEVQAYVASSAGFCVFSALDSQLLWLVRAGLS